VVSEHPPGVPPRPAHFLPRNRLIAALAAAVVVVEAAEESGSLSTAKAAGGRGSGRVLVVPGAPWDAGAAGCNALIRDGATLVRGLADILEELGVTAAPASGPPAAATPASALGGTHSRMVLAALVDGGVLGAPRLAALTGLEPADLAGALLELELVGLVRRSAAGVQAVALPGSSPPPEGA
jgi:DNA processing protein